MDQLSLSFAPLLPLPWLYVFAAIGLALLALGFYRRAAGSLWRLLALLLALALLANPITENAQRQAVRDVALLLLDDSASQNLPGRREQMAAALPNIRTVLKQSPDLDWKEIHLPGRDSTLLAGALAQALADIPPERRAGAIIVSDGQAHDVKEHLAALRDSGPVHLLLTGQPDDHDRRIELLEVPHFGLVGKTVTARLRVLDQPQKPASITQLMLHSLNGDDQIIEVTTGQVITLTLPIEHAGDNIFTVTAPPVEGELTTLNNRAVLRVQGVREKLRVMLVSGDPHPVERTWRNLLRADPAVELVHFTILRPPHKQDNTPINELSLIGFPVQELFQDRLRSFDLVIFDRFRKQGMLPIGYYENIADYVEQGGAFLDASGASYVTPQSLYQTPLARILPTRPQTELRTDRFIPQLTKRGLEHPVTQQLGDPQKWGPWYHQPSATPQRGQVLMQGNDDLPLLVLDHVGKGRVAQLLSDSMWLWARGHAGGGPASELLRRIAHWLMREPDLEEDRLRISVAPAGDNYQLTITRPTPEPANDSFTITAPDGSRRDLALITQGESATASVTVSQIGTYTVLYHDKEQLVLVGDPDAPETQDMLATDAVLKPLLEASGGGSFWLAEHKNGVDIRRTRRNGSQAGSDWLGLRRNEQSIVTGVQAKELLPVMGWLILLTAAIMLGWRREGK